MYLLIYDISITSNIVLLSPNISTETLIIKYQLILQLLQLHIMNILRTFAKFKQPEFQMTNNILTTRSHV